MKIIISFLSAIFFFCSVALPAPTYASEQSFTIAFQGPITGAGTHWGDGQLNAAKFVVSHFNERFKGRYKVSLVVFDDQGQPEISQRIAPGVASNEKIIGLVGPVFSGAALSALPYYDKYLLPTISPSASSMRLREANFSVFHSVSSYWEIKAAALVKNALEGISNPRIFSIQDESINHNFSHKYLDLAIPDSVLVGKTILPSSPTDWTKTISQIRASTANIVVSSAFSNTTFLKQLNKSGYTGIFASSEEFLMDLYSENQSLDLLSIPSGVRLTLSTAPLGAINAQFDEYFAKFTGRISNWYTAESIDATNVFLYCITKGVTTRPQMLDCVKNFEGTSIYGNKFSFDSKGEMIPSRLHSFEMESDIGYFKTLSNSSRLTAQEVIEQFPWHPKVQARTLNSQVDRKGGKWGLLTNWSTITCIKISSRQGAWSLEVNAVKPECPIGYKKSNRSVVTFFTCSDQLALIGAQLFRGASYYKNSKNLWSDQNLLSAFIKTNNISVPDVKDRFIKEVKKQISSLESVWNKYDYSGGLLAKCKKAGRYPLWLETGANVISLKNSFTKDLIPLITANNMK